MELQWNQSNCAYLRRNLWETQNLEQSQELRLPDGMPDIGRVICAWGQPVLRSKEWRKDGIAVTCGVTAWVLVAPEDGATPQCLEVWLPFQAKWSLTDSQREGAIRLNTCLRSIDARTLSARKIMVRASLGLQVEAMEPMEQAMYQPGELPDGVQVLHKTYPALLPREAGEKVFSLEEEAAVSGAAPGKILYCRVYPVIAEQTVMGSRAVFKGNCKVRLLYMTENGAMEHWFAACPFAQYADLDREYDKDAQLSVEMAVSSLETQVAENRIHIKCGLVGQYLVLDRQMIRLSEDAYSPWRSVKPTMELCKLPMILDRTQTQFAVPAWVPEDAKTVVDQSLFPDQPIQFREGENMISQLGCLCQTLYYDEQGNLLSGMEPHHQQWQLPLSESGSAFVRIASEEMDEQGNAALTMEAMTVSDQEMPMISGLHMGDETKPDPNRPSLILCRAGNRSLWELAKACGSTVDMIQKANQLTGEPEAENTLLIPVI